MSEILTVIMNGFVAMCPKKQMWCREFANDNTFGKMVAMLDQIIYMVWTESWNYVVGPVLSIRYRCC